MVDAVSVDSLVEVAQKLSAVARQISGTQWNGFPFFGLGLPAEALNDEKGV